jgi:hypothetical protein
MPRKPKRPLTREEQLLEELADLRAENAYLKKLQALIQSESEKEEKRKSSKNYGSSMPWPNFSSMLGWHEVHSIIISKNSAIRINTVRSKRRSSRSTSFTKADMGIAESIWNSKTEAMRSTTKPSSA